MGEQGCIGIFDSGVGGLSVARSIRAALPFEDLLYIADSANAPYGDKSPEFVEQRALEIANFLITKGAKALVVACNTATVSTAKVIRERFTVPIIGVEPGVKPAIALTKTGVIGVLATEQTVRSASFIQLAERFSGEAEIIRQGCPGLVELIEQAKLDSFETKFLLHKLVIPLLNKGADTLVMGCTHYAFIVPLLREIVGNAINIVTTHEAVASQVVRRLNDAGASRNGAVVGRQTFWTNKQQLIDSGLIGDFWGARVSVNLMP